VAESGAPAVPVPSAVVLRGLSGLWAGRSHPVFVSAGKAMLEISVSPSATHARQVAGFVAFHIGCVSGHARP